jgi:preprotein translocase subunit SecD
MITGRGRFNLYLLVALLALAAGGCQTHKNDKNKQIATLRVHLEASPEDNGRTTTVPIYRAQPFEIQVQQDPFLTEVHVAAAHVVEALGGFELQIQLNREGTWLLQQYSATYRGKHFAVFSQFGDKVKDSRWLAAPQFNRLISDGIIQFTPDASREEAEQIALGLNNLAKKNEISQKW